jgi:superfamily II DNA or RNA helicase
MSYPEIFKKDFTQKIYDKKEFNDYINSETYVFLKQQQLFLKNYISPLTSYQNILIYHSLGTGKTLSAISIIENFSEYLQNRKKKAIILVKNETISENFKKEMDFYDHEIGIKNKRIYKFINFGKFKNQVLGKPEKVFDPISNTFKNVYKVKEDINDNINLSGNLVIVDEVHNILNNSYGKALQTILNKSIDYRLILLSATPLFDNTEELIPLINLLSIPIHIPDSYINKILYTVPDTNRDFTLFKKDIKSITVEGRKIIKKLLKGKISFYDINKQNYPKRINKKIKCEMSNYQYSEYQKALHEDLYLKKDSLYKKTIEKSAIAINNEDNLTKENLKEYSTKLDKIVEGILNLQGIQLIFSSSLIHGTDYIVKALRLHGFKEFLINGNNPPNYKGYLLITSERMKNPKDRLRIIQYLNQDSNIDGKKIKVLIMSKVLAEGITLKNVRGIHLLEPHWNNSLIEQVIGRAIRNNSHIKLPLDERNVIVYKYIAEYKNLKLIDDQMYEYSDLKQKSIDEILLLFKEIAVDCNIHINKNILENPGLKCNEEVTKNNQIDESTYNIKFHGEFQRDKIHQFIIESFKERNIWTLNELIIKLKKKYPNIYEKNFYFELNDFIKNKVIINKTENEIDVEGFIKYLNNYYIWINKDKSNNKINSYLDLKYTPKKVNKEYQYTLEDFINELENQEESNYYNIGGSKITDTFEFKKIKDKVKMEKIKSESLEEEQDIAINEKESENNENEDMDKYPIYGKIEDSKFKIILKKIATNKREINRGKNCISFSKTELQSFYNILGLKFGNGKSKEDLCK